MCVCVCEWSLENKSFHRALDDSLAHGRANQSKMVGHLGREGSLSLTNPVPSG